MILLFFFFLLFKNEFILLEVNYFAILWQFLPYIDMNQPQMDMCPPFQNSLPFPSPSNPSAVSQCMNFESPVSCMELGQVIYFAYGNIHVSMLFSQIIPPSSLSHRVQKSVFYICVSFGVLHNIFPYTGEQEMLSPICL